MTIIPSDQPVTDAGGVDVLYNMHLVQHAMRTKLGIILGSTELLSLSNANLDNEALDDLKRIKRASQQLLAMVDALGTDILLDTSIAGA